MSNRKSKAGTTADSSTPDEVTKSSQNIAKPNVSCRFALWLFKSYYFNPYAPFGEYFTFKHDVVCQQKDNPAKSYTIKELFYIFIKNETNLL